MSLPVQEWSTSLTQRIQAAVARSETEQALQLVQHGDGRSRDLGHEFHLLHKGLGITVRVIADVLTRRELLPQDRMVTLLEEFREMYLRRAQEHLPTTEAPPGPSNSSDPVAWAAAVGDLVRWAERVLERDQVARARGIEQLIRDGRDVDAALRDKVDASFRPVHDAIIEFMAAAFAAVYDHGGAGDLYDLQLAVADGQRAGIDKWEAGGSEGLAAAFAHLLVQHLGDFSVREEDDRFVFEQHLCGSGGRLIRDGYYYGPGSLPVVSGPGVVTGGHGELPVYCTHCPMWNSHAPQQWYGHEHAHFVDPARPDGACTLVIPKFDRSR